MLPLILLVLSMGLLFLILRQFGSCFNDGDEQASAKKEELAATMEKVTRIEQLLTVGLTALLLGAEAGITAIILLSVADLYAAGWLGGFINALVLSASGGVGVWVYRQCFKKKWLENLFGGVAVLGIIVLLILRWLYIHGMPSDLTTLVEQIFTSLSL